MIEAEGQCRVAQFGKLRRWHITHDGVMGAGRGEVLTEGQQGTAGLPQVGKDDAPEGDQVGDLRNNFV